MNERIEKWAKVMFEKEIARVASNLEIARLCSSSAIESEPAEYFAQNAKDLEFYLGWLNELREYANV